MASKNNSAQRLVDQFLKGKAKPNYTNKNTIRNDKWDREDYNSILKEMRELESAESELVDHVRTGSTAMEDQFFALMKSAPDLKDPKDVRPDHLINRAVMDEAMDLDEYNQLRLYSATDEVASGLACVAMEPELEILFDKLQKQQEQSQQLQQMMEQMEGLEGEASDAAGSAEEALTNGDKSEAKDFQEQQARAEEQMEKLRQEMEKLAAEIDAGVEETKPEIKEHMRDALKEAADQAENLDTCENAWGMDKGGLHRLPAEKRIELARKLNNDKFRRIAQLFGPMSRMALAEQTRKTTHAREEIYDIELGNNLNTALPTELIGLDDDIASLLFFIKYNEQQLLQYKMRGNEKIAKGGIIFCEDGSGSMSGDREVWAKAVGLSLLQIAKLQKRDFLGIHFGGPAEFKKFLFDHGKSEIQTEYKATKETFSYLDGVIDFAECHFGGGTDFVTPLTLALEKLKEQHDRDGAVKGDIVFCTDGACGVPDQWLEDFKIEQEKLGFKVFGIIIGGSPNSEPLRTICDGRVFTIDNLTNGDDVRDIFRGI